MFEGTVPPAMCSIVAEHARRWPLGSDVYIGCSGNLTLERTLHPLTAAHGFRLHSNDVNPYSCALGWFFSGQPVPFRLREESREAVGWLEDYLDDGVGTLATLLLGSRWLKWVGLPGAYFQRMVAGFHDQWPQLFAKTVTKLSAATLRLDSFTPGDVREYLAAAPPDAPVALFPPFQKGGYERMFAGLDAHFEWPAPQYEVLDDDGKAEIVAMVMDRPHWLLGLHYEPPELAPYRVGFVQNTPRSVPILVFAHPGVARYVGPAQKSEPVLMPRLGPHDELGGQLRLHPLSVPQFNSLRSAYLNKGIAPGEPLFACAVASDNRIIGAFGYKWDPAMGLDAYLMSDFAVAPSRYRRLSKLVVMAAISAEAQILMQRQVSRRITTWATTAFSNNPSSAKYGRGVPGVVLYSRKKCSDGVHRFQLQYGGTLGQWSLSEALARWSTRHGRFLHGEPDE